MTKHHRHRVYDVFAAVVLLGLCILALSSQKVADRQSAVKPSATPTHTPRPTPTPINPLAVATIRNHPTPGGTITVERELAARSGCRTFVVSYPSDGLKVYSLMSQPASPRPATGYPVLILAHGYIEPASYRTEGTDYQGFINWYCSHGYLVFKPDYRGNDASQGEAIGGHFSADYAYDVLNLGASLRTLPLADASRLGLLGHSMGGHVVLRAAVADHGLPIKATIFASGVVGSLEDIAYNWPNAAVPADIKPLRQKLIEAVGTPAQNPTFWHDGSAINYVAAIKGAVQIHHGDADTVVPLAFAQHLDTALTAVQKPHEFYVYPGGDHQFIQAQARNLLLQRSLDLLDKTVKP